MMYDIGYVEIMRGLLFLYPLIVWPIFERHIHPHDSGLWISGPFKFDLGKHKLDQLENASSARWIV